MSFYVGHPGGNAQCHITHGAHDLTTMRGGVFSDTIFHTDVSYPTFVSYDIVTHLDLLVAPWPGTRDVPPESSWPQITIARIPTAAHTKIRNGSAFLLISTNGDIRIPVPQNIYYGDTSAYVGKAGVGVQWGPYTTGDMPPHYVTNSPTFVGQQDLPYTGEVSAILARGDRLGKIVVFNFSPTAYTQYPNFTGSEVLIKPSVFSVGGFNLSNLSYITADAVNTYDKTGSQLGSGLTPYQLVNSNPATGAITMQSNSTGTFLKIGDKYILRSDKPVPTYQGTTSVTGSVPHTLFGERAVLTINTSPLQAGDLLVCIAEITRTQYIDPYYWVTTRDESVTLVYTEGKTYYLQHGLFRIWTDFWQPLPNDSRGPGYYIRCSGGNAVLYNNTPSLGGLADDIVTNNTTTTSITVKSMKMY